VGASPTLSDLVANADTAAQDDAGVGVQISGRTDKQAAKPAKHVEKSAKKDGKKSGSDGKKTADEGNKPAGDADSTAASGDEKKPAGEGDKKPGGEGESKDSGIAVAAFKWLVSEVSDVTLKAQVGSAMPEDKTANDFKWKGPVDTTAVFPREKSTFHLTTIAYAEVEISFYYSGKYINNFHAKLVDAELDRTASLACELSVDDTNVGNSPDGIAHIDWTITFRRGHFIGGSKIVTVTGRASGDGTYTTSQPGFDDMVQEAEQEEAAHTPPKP
jgi:hypothetical protein